MMLVGFWSTYFSWYNLLVEWAGMLVTHTVARRCARHAMAEVFIRACNGMTTVDGPYMDSVDVLYRLLAMENSQRGTIFVASAFQRMRRPDAEMLCDITRLYAATYETTYNADLSICEREHLAILVRLFDPAIMNEDQLRTAIEQVGDVTHPVRRVVERVDNHTHGDEISCVAASLLWEAEHQRSEAWLKDSAVETGGL